MKAARYEHQTDFMLEKDSHVEFESSGEQSVLSRSVDWPAKEVVQVSDRHSDSESDRGGGLWHFCWVLFLLCLLAAIGYLCYTGKGKCLCKTNSYLIFFLNQVDFESCCRVCRGSITGAIKGVREANENNKKKDDSADEDDQEVDEDIKKGKSKGKSSKTTSLTRKNDKISKKEREKSNKSKKKKSHKKEKKRQLAETIHSSRIARTIESIGQLGKQLGNKIALWNRAKDKLTNNSSDMLQDSWLDQSSDSMPSLSDYTENGGIELFSSSMPNSSATSLSTVQLLSISPACQDALIGEPCNNGDPFYAQKQSDIITVSDHTVRSRSWSQISAVSMAVEVSDKLTGNSSSFLSTEEDEFDQTEQWTSTACKQLPVHQTYAVTTRLSQSNWSEAILLAETISSLVNRYLQLKPRSNYQTGPSSKQLGSAKSCSPSTPHLLKPGQFKRESEHTKLARFYAQNSFVNGDSEMRGN